MVVKIFWNWQTKGRADRCIHVADTWVVVTSAKSRPWVPLTRVRMTVTRLPLRTNRASAFISPSR